MRVIPNFHKPVSAPFRAIGLAAAVTFTSGSAQLMSAAPPAENAQPARSCADTLGQLQPLSGAELDSELEILSWNIQKASSDGWADDLSSFTDGIHLAFIQEASLQASLESVTPGLLHQFFASGYITGDQETGVMTLSSGFPSMRCKLTAWEPWLGTPKATSITEYALRDRSDRLLAINLHAVNFALGLENFKAQFDALSDLLARHEGPVILAGDLNTWSQQRETLVNDFLLGHGLSAVPFTPDLRTRAFGRALDHIYTRGMDSDAARVIPVTSSDHNALRVRLTIN